MKHNIVLNMITVRYLKILARPRPRNNHTTIVFLFLFYSLENLQYLRLGDNNLHSIPSDSLRRLHRLRHLDLKANNISFISEDAFTGFGDSITFLNLQKNE